MSLRMNGLGQASGFFSPEDQASIDRVRYGAGQVYDTGKDVYQSGRKVYDVIPASWRPVLLGIAIGWWLKGR